MTKFDQLRSYVLNSLWGSKPTFCIFCRDIKFQIRWGAYPQLSFESEDQTNSTRMSAWEAAAQHRAG
jgi:hypothetical protein